MRTTIQINKRILLRNARALRKEATEAELALLPYAHRVSWGMVFQHPVAGIERCGYVLDFAIPRKRIGIEVDGTSHFSDKAIAKDEIRSANLNRAGWIILRVKDADCLLTPGGVAAAIRESIFAIEHMHSDPWHDGFVTVDWHPVQMPGPKPRAEDKPVRILPTLPEPGAKRGWKYAAAEKAASRWKRKPS